MQLVITAPETTTDIREALAIGSAKVYSERGNGTLRRRHYLTGTAREHAEWIALQRSGQEADASEGIVAVAPRSMASIAKELHVSISDIRRTLVDLAITEEIEDADQDELETLMVGSQEDNAADLTDDQLLEEAEYGQP